MAGPIAQRGLALAETLNLTACDREPIHVPGAVQPHGLLLVADASSLEVVAGAGAIEPLFGENWLGAHLGTLLAQDVVLLAEAVPAGPGGTILAAPTRGHDVALHRTGPWLLAEVEPSGEAVGGSVAETLGWLDAMAAGFERTSSFSALCERAAVAFRALTGFDRVMVYRFLDDESGCVVAEDRAPDLDTFLHHHFPASDIPRQARALYVRNRARVIPDIDYVAAPLRPNGFELTDLSDVAIRSVSPIHIEYLRNMGVRASASISIVKDGLLWGLVACHHESPRLMPRATRAAAAALAGALARQLRAKEEAEAYRERLALRGEEDALRALLLTSDSPLGVIQERAEDLRQAFGADGLALVCGGRAVTAGVAPDGAGLVALARWLATRDDVAPLATRELGKDWSEAACVAPIAGVLGIALGDEDALLWLRAERIEEIEWAGNPHKAVPHDPQATLRPRASFESWREQVRGRARRWSLEQVDGAARLRRLLAEARAATELRRLNRELERTGAEKDSLLAQKDLLMREVDHRVQNSLQLVSSFLAIQARDAGAGAVADQLLEARSRLSAVALVHRRLYRDDQIEVIDLSRYIGELMQDLRASLGDEWSRHLTLDLAPVLIPTDRAVSVGLIAAELVINATKYAYPGARGGPIDVVLERHGHLFRLIVADRGAGKIAGEGSGFGSRMMTAVVQRIGGTVEFQPNDPGTRALLTAPIEGD